MTPRPRLCLASRSPRRAALLRLLGVRFDILAADADERVEPGEAPADYALRVATLKAEAVDAGPGRVVLAADTCVAVDGEIFGKPLNEGDARRMLRTLGGRWHDVYTALALRAADGTLHPQVVWSRVEFVALDDAMIGAYWMSGEPIDKAGAYGIQGLGGALVSRVDGSYSAVVGLPMSETRSLLDLAGVEHALSTRARHPA